MVEFFTIGIIDAISPCSLHIVLFFLGILFLIGTKKNIARSATTLIVAFFITTFFVVSGFSNIAFSEIGISLLIALIPISIISILLPLGLGIYGLVNSYNYKKEKFTTINKYLTSLPTVILFGIILSIFLLPCVALPATGILTIISQSDASIISFPIYLLGLIVPFAIASFIAYVVGTNEKDTKKLRNLRLIGSILLIISAIPAF